MKFRIGLFVGFGVGYYLGARAGRERYEQLRGLVVHTPLSKVQAAYRARSRAPARAHERHDRRGGPALTELARDERPRGRCAVFVELHTDRLGGGRDRRRRRASAQPDSTPTGSGTARRSSDGSRPSDADRSGRTSSNRPSSR